MNDESLRGDPALSNRIKAKTKYDGNNFSEYEYYNIMIGEESGALAVALNELAAHYKTRMKQKRQLVSALSYPILACIMQELKIEKHLSFEYEQVELYTKINVVQSLFLGSKTVLMWNSTCCCQILKVYELIRLVLVVAFAAVTFMLNVIVPMFAGVFQRFGGELPAITQTILNISNFLSAHILAILIILGLIVAVIIFIKRYEWYKKVSSQLLLKTPIMGRLMLKIYLARFCSSLYLLTSSGAPLINALELIGKMIRFYPLNQAIHGMIEGISRGMSLNGSMRPYKLFDAQFTSLVKVGEETGKLEYILQQLQNQYSEEVEYRTKQLGSLLEPILILGVGIMVLIILVAMYLPLFQLSTSII